MQVIKTPKKLIEVALPLDAINEAAAREKSIRHGHPSTLHLWWARRPLAAARAVIFAQMVNDPGYERSLGRGVNKEKAQIERERLFSIIRRLVLWENTNSEAVLNEARAEILKSWRETCDLNKSSPSEGGHFDPRVLPAFHDPFSGGGTLPLEAQRLGLESNASDLNPVAVLINKAMIEIPPRFSGRSPVGPVPPGERQGDIVEDWRNARGLAEDVRRYGTWMRNEAERRIGDMYPKVVVSKEMGGGAGVVTAWLWARTVRSPNPAFSHVDVPLVSSFVLSGKAGRAAYIEPEISGDAYRLKVRYGKPPEAAKRGTTAGKRKAFLCLLSGAPIDYDYIRAEGKAGRIGRKLLAIVAEQNGKRVFLSPTDTIEKAALAVRTNWKPDTRLPNNPRDFKTPNYGMDSFGDLFSPRQLVALTTFADLVHEAWEKIRADAARVSGRDDKVQLEEGGAGATAYADAVATYLAFAVGRSANYWSSNTPWGGDFIVQTFGRQAIPMVWDYAEANPFSLATGNWLGAIEWIVKCLCFSIPAAGIGHASQRDAQTQDISFGKVVSTDPPYYDNIGYADLSDYFYVWLRRALRSVYPSLFATMVVPKAEELVATPYRHGSKEKAEEFFLSGMTAAMQRLADLAHPAFPTTIYYAFKQSDTTDVGTGNTGWETFLSAVLSAGFSISGTWPLRTERDQGLKTGSNVLASSIVLVCRRRPVDAPSTSRREFLRELRDELSEAVDTMIGGARGVSAIAAVDLAQAAIGPGMAIFSKYASVLEADGTAMTVHTALTLINRMLVEGGDDFDSDSQFCLGWFEANGWDVGEFGKADVLARAKGTSVDGVSAAGVVEARRGRVRLVRPVDYPEDWTPTDDNRTPVWEALHQMIRALKSEGESAAGALLARMPQRSDPIRNLAYRLHILCERKGWADDARSYNELIASWQGIETASHEAGHVGSQTKLDI